MNHNIKVIDIVDQEDGSAKVIFEVDDQFKKVVKDYYGLKRFSHKKFEEFINEGIRNYIKIKEGEKP